jgi:hypothetical protein
LVLSPTRRAREIPGLHPGMRRSYREVSSPRGHVEQRTPRRAGLPTALLRTLRERRPSAALLCASALGERQEERPPSQRTGRNPGETSSHRHPPTSAVAALRKLKYTVDLDSPVAPVRRYSAGARARRPVTWSLRVNGCQRPELVERLDPLVAVISDRSASALRAPGRDGCRCTRRRRPRSARSTARRACHRSASSSSRPTPTTRSQSGVRSQPGTCSGEHPVLELVCSLAGFWLGRRPFPFLVQ